MKTSFLKSLLAAAAMSFVCAGSSLAITYHWSDDMVAFPLYENASFPLDYYGNPKISELRATVENGLLTRIEIDQINRQIFDSLFVNTDWDGTLAGWHDWDYYVYDQTGGLNDAYPHNLGIAEGLYEVSSGYTYTTAAYVRTGHPVGITNNINFVASLNPSYDGATLVYDFSGLFQGGLALGDKFSIGYAPWCANDVVGSPVPEPASLLLLGSGLMGLAGFARRRKS